MTPRPSTISAHEVSLYEILGTPGAFGAAGEINLTKKTETMDEAEALGDDPRHHV